MSDELGPPFLTPRFCERCGTVCGAPVCFACFLGRPFVKNTKCPACGELAAVVRQYLQGPACDPCAEARARAAKTGKPQ